MASVTTWEPYEARPRMPAWIASTGFHAAMLLAFGFWLDRLPQGGTIEPGLGKGLVLERAATGEKASEGGLPEGTYFEGEPEPVASATASEATVSAEQQMIAALPDAGTPTALQGALPQLPKVGNGSLNQGSSGNAGALTSGGGTSGNGPGRGGSGGGDGSAAKVSVFGVEGEGHKFVYAFDRSVSMDGAPLRAAKYQLLYSLASLDSIHQFQILFFNHKVSLFDLTGGQNRIAFADAKNIHNAKRYVEGVSADGGTDRETALIKALSFAPDVVFFLTDADDPMSAGEVQKVIQRSHRAGTKICVIEFGTGPDPEQNNFLKQIATDTGGDYGYVDTNLFEK